MGRRVRDRERGRRVGRLEGRKVGRRGRERERGRRVGGD